MMNHRLTALTLAAALGLTLTACGGGTASQPTAAQNSASGAQESTAPSDGAVASGVEDGVLTVGMECAYAPYNWTQVDDANGAVPIANQPGSYANGYDIIDRKSTRLNSSHD